MADTTSRTHPLIVITATTVILTCLLAIGIMTGIVPSPLARDRGFDEQASTAAPGRSAAASAATEHRVAPRAPATHEHTAASARSKPREAVGTTSGSAPSQAVGGTGLAPKVAAICANCGTVTSVRAVTHQGEAGLVGPAAGTAVGGLLGHQIGGGSGKTIATIAGAAIGAGVGTEVERRAKSTTQYVVGVRLENGTARSFTFNSAPGFQQGDRVRVVEGRLVRDS